MSKNFVRILLPIAGITVTAGIAVAFLVIFSSGSSPALAHEIDVQVGESEPSRMTASEGLAAAEDALGFDVRLPDTPATLELAAVHARTGPPGIPRYDIARAVLVYRAVDSRESGLVVFEVEQVTASEHGIAPAPDATEIDTITAGGVSYTVFHEGSGPGGDGVELTGFSAIPDDPTDAFSYIYRIGTTVEAGDDIDRADLALRALRSQLDD